MVIAFNQSWLEPKTGMEALLSKYLISDNRGADGKRKPFEFHTEYRLPFKTEIATSVLKWTSVQVREVGFLSQLCSLL